MQQWGSIAAHGRSLAVGYENSDLLLRPYSARQEGYETASRWAWEVGEVGAKTARLDACAMGFAALRLATELFETPRVGRYACGRNAYRRWAELLLDELSLSRLTDPERFAAILGHAHTLESLADARAAAVNYLTLLSELAPAAARPAFDEAAGLFADLEKLLWQKHRTFAPYPWELPSLSAWEPGLRSEQAAFLSDVADRDGRAFACLVRAVNDVPSFESSTLIP